MSDITMCQNSSCPLKEDCVRWTAVADAGGWKSYADFKPSKDGKSCENFFEKNNFPAIKP